MTSVEKFKCRNCACWHEYVGNYIMFTENGVIWESGSPESVCDRCTSLPKFENSTLGCCKYEPSDNLEFLAWKYNVQTRSL